MIKVLVYLNLVLTLLLMGGFYWLVFIYKPLVNYSQFQSQSQVGVDRCGEECKKQIELEVESKIAALPTTAPSKETTTVVEKVVSGTPTKSTQTTYISLTGPITTTSSSWYDVPGTEFSLDMGSFGSSAKATWDASLKVAHNNGTAYARLFDITHGIAVDGSEISLTNNSTLTQVYSGNLNFWSGNNKYRVQLKSLNTFEVTFGSGRVKITY